MEKPIYLRTKTWNFLKHAISKLPNTQLYELAQKYNYSVSKNMPREKITQKIIDEPAAFLFELNILNHPELLKNTIIELNDEIEYLIDTKTAESLKRGDNPILITRYFDKRSFYSPREKIIEALASKCTFDQMED